MTKQKDNQIRLRVAFQDTMDFDDFVSKLRQLGWGVVVAPDFPLE